jgi:hypothetical protein
MTYTTIEDPVLIKKACEMRQTGMFVSDIAKLLSEESGKQITQMALWRLFNDNKEEEPIKEKRRQGQRGATPKPLCPECGEILKRTYTRELVDGKQRYIPAGWSCPSITCDHMEKDLVELKEKEEENVDKVKNFAEACCDQKSVKELKEALAGAADETDMKTWNLTNDQWHEALKIALIAIENNLSVNEAIKCIS